MGRFVVWLAPLGVACGSGEVFCSGGAESFGDEGCAVTFDCPADGDLAASYQIDCDCGGFSCETETAPAESPYSCTCLTDGVVTGTFDSVDLCRSDADVWVAAERGCGFELPRD